MSKTYTRAEMDALLRKNGWEQVRVAGSHYQYRKQGSPDVITVNLRPNKCVCQRLIKQYGLKE